MIVIIQILVHSITSDIQTIVLLTSNINVYNMRAGLNLANQFIDTMTPDSKTVI